MKFLSFSVSRLAAIALTLLLSFFLCIEPAIASNDLQGVAPSDSVVPNGAVVFENNCAGCHVNGGNIVRRGKNLKLKTLQKNGVDSVEAIAQLVTHGRGLMSAYGDRLSIEEITTVAKYVTEQAKQDWKN
ncbi:MAG: c-type cytochrome [Timaviella obliquedivisa GSE-PSE-MK23-08B]|jgi:cytochrome c6|nr:c-type cytochrome [Timaviella obliquedivisa GSE-PSE-MK23-08B]